MYWNLHCKPTPKINYGFASNWSGEGGRFGYPDERLGGGGAEQGRRARGREDGRHQAFHRTFPGTPGEWPQEVLESLQPEAQSARQAATDGGPPLFFVRVSTPTSPQNQNFLVFLLTIWYDNL